MKLYRNAVILVVILALLFGAYWFLKDKKPAEDSTGDTAESIKLTDLTDDKISQISVENKDGVFVLEKKDTNWTLVSPTNIKADPSKLSSISTNASSIIADKLVEENPKDLSAYGLDKPVTVTIKLKEGGEKVVLIGNQTPTKGGYYAMMKSEAKVYVIDSYTAEKLLFSRNDIRDTTLYTIESTDVDSLSLDRNGTNVFTSKKTSDSEWAMLKPIEGNVNTTAIDPMLTALAGVKVKEFVEDDAKDLSKYGLDNPAYKMSFTTTYSSISLELGTEKTKGSEIYAKLSGSNEVFTIDDTAFTFLDKPFKEIIEVFVYIVNIDKVNKIELDMDGKKTTFGIQVYKDAEGQTDTDKDKFTVDGKDASGKDKDDKQPFRNFYQELIGIGLDDIAPDATPTGTPELTITYTLNEAPGVMKVEFVPKDANYDYVLKNGKYTGILVDRNKESFGIAAMKKSYQTLMDFVAAQK